MSDEKKPSQPLLDWFKHNYPSEYYLQEEIAKRVDKVFRNIVSQIPDGQVSPIIIGVSKHPNAAGSALSMSEFGIVFVGAMAKAILDSLSAEFEALLSTGIGNEIVEKKVKEVVSQHRTSTMKKCPYCQSEIRMNAQFCDQCGGKLES